MTIRRFKTTRRMANKGNHKIKESLVFETTYRVVNKAVQRSRAEYSFSKPPAGW
jgi:hypothetical protein